MNTLRNRIFATTVSIAALGALITSLAPRAKSAGGAVPVQITGNVYNSDVDNSARQPYQAAGFFTARPSSQDFILSFTVPAGKRLVIKGYSLTFYDASASIHPQISMHTVAGGTSADHIIGLGVLLDSANGRADYIQPMTPVEIYSDPNTTSFIEIAGIDATAVANGSGYGTVTGYLVNLP